MLIGMFHIRKDPNKVSRAYLYSTIARHEGHDFFYFTAKGVDFEKKEILGKHYSNGRWVTKRFPFPMSSSTPPTRTLPSRRKPKTV